MGASSPSDFLPPFPLCLSTKSVFLPNKSYGSFSGLLYFIQAMLTFKISTLQGLPDILLILFLDIQGLFPLGKNIFLSPSHTSSSRQLPREPSCCVKPGGAGEGMVWNVCPLTRKTDLEGSQFPLKGRWRNFSEGILTGGFSSSTFPTPVSRVERQGPPRTQRAWVPRLS